MTARRAGAVDDSSALSVWAVAQQTAPAQRRGRYLDASTAHPGKMLPELARTIIRAYSQPGELVLDPMCGIGTTLVEAIHLDRDGAGVELEARWASLTAPNVALAREQGAPASALCLQGDARRLGRGLLDELAGQAALILTSPPYGPSLHGQVKAGHGRRVEKWDDRYSHNPRSLAHLPASSGRRPSFAGALAEILAGCGRMLARHGRLVLTARPYRSQGVLVDLPGAPPAAGSPRSARPGRDARRRGLEPCPARARLDRPLWSVENGRSGTATHARRRGGGAVAHRG
ncbi:MAG: TRM11 family SAM-dependent methyltransferase [Thermoleophilaceae bacterium]